MTARKGIRAKILADTKLTGAIRDHVTQDDHAGEGELRVIGLEKIRPNPDNPRKIDVSPQSLVELRERAQAQTSGDTERSDESATLSTVGTLIENLDDTATRNTLEGIYLLARSIQDQGLIQPISVFSTDDTHYVIMAGERRYLAHVLLGRKTIRAMVREPSADVMVHRVGALVENIVRENLSTAEKVDYIEELATLHQARHGTEITAEALHELIHESVRTCRRYLRYLNAPPSIREAIRSGELGNVRDIEDALKRPVESSPVPEPDVQPPKNRGRGRQRTAVTLGKTANTSAIRQIILATVGADQFDREYADVDWTDLDEAQKAWKRFFQSFTDERES